MSADDWQDACDPVQRRELTDAEKRRLQALMKLRRKKGYSGAEAPPCSWVVNPEFDKMGGR